MTCLTCACVCAPCQQALTQKQLAALAGAADAKNPVLLTVGTYAVKEGVQGNRAETALMLDWNEVEKHANKHGHIDGVVTEVGQTKVCCKSH